MVEGLREDPGAEVQVAEVDGRGRRLRAWAWVPGMDGIKDVRLQLLLPFYHCTSPSVPPVPLCVLHALSCGQT